MALALAACSSKKKSDFVDAATTPLRDLNVIRAEIPDVLRDAQKRPYLVPADPSCEALATELRALDKALGPDLDAPASPSNPRLIERAAEAADDAAVGAVQHAAEGLVPYRGWVRQLSGAERYSKKVAAAIAAGAVRRGFLKGLSVARNCPRAE